MNMLKQISNKNYKKFKNIFIIIFLSRICNVIIKVKYNKNLHKCIDIKIISVLNHPLQFLLYIHKHKQI